MKSIDEIMSIQRIKAVSKKIELTADLSSLENTMIIHDESRI